MNYLFVLVSISFLVSYGNPCSAQKEKTTESYKTYIKQADKAFDAADYANAMELYEKANKVEPEYNYPVNKIEQIKKILEAKADPNIPAEPQNMSTNASYKLLLAQADNAYNNLDYGVALLLYEKADLTKPDYYYASDKIDEINKILNAAPETKTVILESTIRKADSLYEKHDYPQAKTEYEKAALIDTSAQLPKERLDEISAVYVDPADMSNFNLAIANGDKALASGNYELATTYYDAALVIRPNAKIVNKKITNTKTQQTAFKEKTAQPVIAVAAADKVIQPEVPAKETKLQEKPDTDNKQEKALQQEQHKYDETIAAAESSLKSADYQAALAGFKSASAIKPSEKYPQTKITEIEKLIAAKTAQMETDKNYAVAIANGDQFLSGSKYSEALNSFKQALSIKPSEKYPSDKIAEINSIVAKQKSDADNYNLAISAGDKALVTGNYSLALTSFQDAAKIKPSEKYPADKIAEINSIVAKQKSDADNYALSVRAGEKALSTGNYTLALTSFQDAAKIKPSEKYPMEQITEIKTQMAAQQQNEEKYNNVIKKADQLFADKEYNSALTAYTEAANIKRTEKHPQEQIVKINKIITDSRTVDDNYKLAITEGDKLFMAKNYPASISAYNKASALKPAETYPIQRITEINKVIEETKLAHSSEYTSALEVADKLYNTKVFDKAIDAYEAAAKINPHDSYPEMQINKIRKYMSDHALLNLNIQVLTISKGNEKKFTFEAIDPSLRKNNYILLKARSLSNNLPKVYLNYGEDNTKNGGIVLRNLDRAGLSDLLISISTQDKWFREDNNWISISVETGEIEITSVQISAGE